MWLSVDTINHILSQIVCLALVGTLNLYDNFLILYYIITILLESKTKIEPDNVLREVKKIPK